MGFFGRIKDSLTRTKQQIVERFDEIVRVADAPEKRARADRRRHRRSARGTADLGRHRRRRDRPHHLCRQIAIAQRHQPARPREGGNQGHLRSGRQTDCHRLASSGDADRRRQRHRQDDHRRQACEPAQERRQEAADLRRRHLSRRRRRATRNLGRPAPASTWSAPAKAPIRRRWCSTRSRRARPRGASRFSSTPPAVCIPAST